MLKANSITKVELRYVCELPVSDNAVRCTVPTTVAPQYTAPEDEGPEKTGAEQLVDLDKDIDIEVTLVLRQSCRFNQSYEGTEQAIEWREEESVDDDGFYRTTALVTYKRTELEEDLVIDVSTVNKKSFGARILIEETEKAEVGAMVTLVPEFPPSDFQAELIFLVDRSGSMQGRSIEKAKEACMIFLASLPADCKFNICSFNAGFDFLFDVSKQYNDKTLEEARDYVNNMIAGGGTRVYEPLETIFKQKLEEGCQRQIFVLTDGHVSRAQDSVNMVKKNNAAGRVFSLGIGEGASRELVNGLARSGNGSAMFVTFAEDLKDKVMVLLESSLLPALTDVTFTWLSDMKPQKSIMSFFKSGAVSDIGTPMTLPERSAPAPIPHVFSGKLLIVYQSLVFAALPVGLKISGNGPSGPVSMAVSLDTTKVMKSELLHKLMARKMVKIMEESDEQPEQHMRQRMVDLGTRYNVGNKYCSTNTTGQFGEDIARPKAKSSPAGPDPPMFQQSYGAPMPPQAAPQMRLRSSPPPLMKKMKGKGAGPPPAMSAPPMNKSYGGPSKYGGGAKKSYGGSEMMQQCSNTRMGKSKMMSNYSYQSASPSPQSSAAKGSQRDGLLMGLMQVQSTDGSFKYGDIFMSELGITEAEMIAEAANVGCDIDFFITLIAVVYLRNMMANRKSSWQRSGSKADDYIAANLGDKDLNEIEGKCQLFLDQYVHKSKSKALFKGTWK